MGDTSRNISNFDFYPSSDEALDNQSLLSENILSLL